LERLFMMITVIGLAYFGFLILFSSKESGSKYRKNGLENLKKRFNNETVQTVLDESGLKLTAQRINIVRYSIAGLYILIQFMINFLRASSFSTIDLLVALTFLLISSPQRYAPFGMILSKIQQRAIIQKDGEVISFMRLYENNRLRKSGHVQFGVFCAQMAEHFMYIRKDLLQLSERSVDDGAEEAIDWFSKQFPSNHAFIGDVRSIFIAIEGMNDNQEAANYLRDQSKAIAKISSDQYQRKWSRTGDIFNVLNAIPSITTLLDLVVLALLYVMLIKGNFDGVSLFL